MDACPPKPDMHVWTCAMTLVGLQVTIAIAFCAVWGLVVEIVLRGRVAAAPRYPDDFSPPRPST
jgi:hypothetical protein